MIVLNATTWSYAIQPILWKNHTHPSIQPTNQCSIEQMHPNSLQRSFGHINHIIYGNYLWMRDYFPECRTTTTTGLCFPEECFELPCNGVFGIQEASFIGKLFFLSKTVLFRKKNIFLGKQIQYLLWILINFFLFSFLWSFLRWKLLVHSAVPHDFVVFHCKL